MPLAGILLAVCRLSGVAQAGGTVDVRSDDLEVDGHDLLEAGEEEEEFLEPDVAFVVTVQKANESSIKTNWLIQDGYYLYKDKPFINNLLTLFYTLYI